VALLRAYRQRCEADATAARATIATDGRVFSLSVDHRTWLKPGSVSQRYRRMCARLGWLRHYSATELIAAGVDVRTVAGRLGHGGGGATTLRVYSAWVSEADQKAAGAFSLRMPAPPVPLDAEGSPSDVKVPDLESGSPYQRIASDVRGAISCGALRPATSCQPSTS
jgi:hypothetical protein